RHRSRVTLAVSRSTCRSAGPARQASARAELENCARLTWKGRGKRPFHLASASRDSLETRSERHRTDGYERRRAVGADRVSDQRVARAPLPDELLYRGPIATA